ncbi:MAG: hypothetical protein OSJ74_03455 [Clostridia bacterium]|nr:hypothetical protein [Clostridia bacterium]
MKSPLFKDNIEDKEIRFKSPKESYIIHNKTVNIKRIDIDSQSEVQNGR